MAAILARVRDRDEFIQVGREAELERLAELLTWRSSPLVLVKAPAGMGKTTFLRAAESLARREGWVVASDASGILEVTRQTTRDGFCARVRESLGLPSHRALVSASGEYERAAGDAGRRDLAVSSARMRRQGVLDELVEQLRDQRWRVLILVDGYRPSESFAAWFEEVFLPDLGRSGSHLVTMIADTPHVLDRPGFASAPTIALGPLDREAVVRHYHALGARMSPPMGPEEVEALADCANQPAMVAAIDRLLSLGDTGGESAQS